MSPSDTVARIRVLCDSMNFQERPDLMPALMAGLQAMQERGPSYDALLDEGNPFFREFLAYSSRTSLSGDDCFGLFECLAIFVRMRQMAHQELSKAEINVLEYFESCGEWDEQDGSMVSRCYWGCLPVGRMCALFPSRLK